MGAPSLGHNRDGAEEEIRVAGDRSGSMYSLRLSSILVLFEFEEEEGPVI